MSLSCPFYRGVLSDETNLKNGGDCMAYLICGPTILNDIIDDDRRVNGVLGGSVYCLAGIRCWTEDCLYISHVGPDFNHYYGSWFQQNHLSKDGLMMDLPHTHYSTLQYAPNGTYTEYPKYGAAYEAMVYPISRLMAPQIARFCGPDTQGIYIEANEDETLWHELSVIRQHTRGIVMWEIPTQSAVDPMRKSKTLQIIQNVDVFSINVPEAMALYGCSDFNDLIRVLAVQTTPCYLRAGESGSYWIANGLATFAPSMVIGPVVDPTGCGNASTAAALFAFVEGWDPELIPRAGNIAAAFNLLQYGPYPDLGPETRQKAKSLLDSCR